MTAPGTPHSSTRRTGTGRGAVRAETVLAGDVAVAQLPLTLNGQGFLIDLASYRKQAGEQFAGKQASGNRLYADLKDVAVWAQTDWRGGRGWQALGRAGARALAGGERAGHARARAADERAERDGGERLGAQPAAAAASSAAL